MAVTLVGDDETENRAPSVVPGSQTCFVTLPFYVRATWVLPGTFEEPIPLAPGKPSPLPHF